MGLSLTLNLKHLLGESNAKDGIQHISLSFENGT